MEYPVTPPSIKFLARCVIDAGRVGLPVVAFFPIAGLLDRDKGLRAVIFFVKLRFFLAGLPGLT